LYIKHFVESYPEVLQDRFHLSFSKNGSMKDIACLLRQQGVVMLRGVLDSLTLRECQRSFASFVRSLGRHRQWGRILDRDDRPKSEWANGETWLGSWHNPWVVRHWLQRPGATIIPAVISSWAWPLVEEMCNATDIAILLSLCQARHAIDVDLGIGAHQDAKVLPAVAPFALWVPLQDVIPRQHSGLGFVVGPPENLLPTLPHNDVGPEYLLNNVDRVWMPEYRAGDVTAHTNLLPHFTTGYGTGADRYSFEIRAVARNNVCDGLDNPGLYVSRVKGVPRIVGTHSEPPVKAKSFLRAFQVTA